MNKRLIYLVPIALVAGHASSASLSGWTEIVADDLGAARAATDGVNLVAMRGGGGHVNRASVNRASVNRSSFDSRSFHGDVSSNRNVSVNRNVNVNRNVSVNRGYYGGGSYGPNWGGVSAGVAVGAGVTAMATSAAAASSTYYPPPPPYQYYPNGYGY